MAATTPTLVFVLPGGDEAPLCRFIVLFLTPKQHETAYFTFEADTYTSQLAMLHPEKGVVAKQILCSVDAKGTHSNYGPVPDEVLYPHEYAAACYLKRFGMEYKKPEY